MKGVKSKQVICFLIIFLLFLNVIPLINSRPLVNDFPFDKNYSIIQKSVNYLYSQQDNEGKIKGLSISSWAAMALSLTDINQFKFEKLKAYLYNQVNNLDNNQATEWERHILGLIACNINPNSVNGINCTQKILDFFDGSQIGDVNNIYDDIFGIISLNSSGLNKNSSVIQHLRNHILSKQKIDGSWGDVDTTAAAIISLIISGEHIDSIIIQNALTFIKSKQDPSGGFISWGSTNLATTAWVMMALNALGEDPLSDYWIEKENSSINYIISLQQSDGSFNYSHSSNQNSEWMTSYAIVALMGKSYPIKIFNNDDSDNFNEDDNENDSNTDNEDNDQDDSNDDHYEDNGGEESLNLEILHPKKKGIYINNKKTKFPSRQLIIFGEIDIRVSVQNDVDYVNFIINGNPVFEDMDPPFNFHIDDSWNNGRLFITIQAVSVNKKINYSKIDDSLNRIMYEMKLNYQLNNKPNFNIVINEAACIIEECIKNCYEKHLDLILINMF